MKFKNVSEKTITVKYNGMVTIKSGEVAELPATYSREGLEKFLEPVVIIEKIKVKKVKTKIEVKPEVKVKKSIFKKFKK